MEKLIEAVGAAGFLEVRHPAQLNEREPIDHAIGHTGGNRLGETGVDKAGAQPRFGRRTGRQAGHQGDSQGRRAPHSERRSYAARPIAFWRRRWTEEPMPSASRYLATVRRAMSSPSSLSRSTSW